MMLILASLAIQSKSLGRISIQPTSILFLTLIFDPVERYRAFMPTLSPPSCTFTFPLTLSISCRSRGQLLLVSILSILSMPVLPLLRVPLQPRRR